jgi:hypothetical protein
MWEVPMEGSHISIFFILTTVMISANKYLLQATLKNSKNNIMPLSYMSVGPGIK